MISDRFIQAVERLFGPEEVILDEEGRRGYGGDETGLFALPDVVVRPRSVEGVSDLVRLCREFGVPLTVRGGGTGLSGGAVPVFGGVVLATDRWCRVVDFVPEGGYVQVQPGIVTQTLQEFLEGEGWYYPPDPASRGSCFVGGNIAEDSAGPHSFKYGTTRRYVRNLRVVTGAGDELWTGSWTTKNAAGYSLTQLVVGSEGTLAIVVEAVLSIIPLPERRVLVAVCVDSLEGGSRLMTEILRSGVYPSAIEMMEHEALRLAKQYLEWEEGAFGSVSLSVPVGCRAMLWIELDGTEEAVRQSLEKVFSVCVRLGVEDVWVAESAHDQERLWRVRRVIGHAVKAYSPYVDADTVVPRHRVSALLDAVKRLEGEIGLKTVCYGHAGDGNIHVNILREDLPAQEWEKRLDRMLTAIFRECLRLGGTLTGEHGVGLVHARRFSRLLAPEFVSLVRAVKRVWDPDGILNPGKFPD